MTLAYLVRRAAAPRPLLDTRARIVGGGLVVLAVAIGAPTAGLIVAIAGIRNPAPVTSSPAGGSTTIPVEALTAYQSAADTYDIDWALLAAIGWEECRHGTSPLPGCLPDTLNPAGARGHMQFIGSTWRASLGQHALEPRTSRPAANGDGFATDGDGDGDADPWSWPDAAHSVARYLVQFGVRDDPGAAVDAYNHAPGYADRVLSTAARYRDDNGRLRLTTVDGITVSTEIATNVASLMHAARTDGLELSGSGYRSHEQQIELRRAHCGTSDYAIYRMPSSQCSPPTARPGASMHEQGLAIDFTCDGALITSRASACYMWLATHAPAYGLYELIGGREPWHWSANGA